jgi:murein DD-endopeptidase MepM/ murein hydrolase activator NlpD
MVSDDYVKLYARSGSASGSVFGKSGNKLQVGRDTSESQFTDEMSADDGGGNNGVSEKSQSDSGNDLNREINLKEVQAPANGTVFAIRYFANVSEYGNYLVIQHNDGRFSVFAHLESIKVEERARVRQGDVIAIAGGTGTLPNMAAHLHWSVFEGVNVLQANTGDNGIFLGRNWVVNTARTVDPQTLVDARNYIHPSRGEITDPYGTRDMPPPRNFHEGIDYSIRRRRE